MKDYSELIKQARAVPGPTLLMTYPAQTTPDPLSNALADALEAQAKEIADSKEWAAKVEDANDWLIERNRTLDARIAELEAEKSVWESFAKRENLGLEYKRPYFADDKDQECCWIVWAETGGRSDLERTVIGKGDTPVDAARAALTGEKG